MKGRRAWQPAGKSVEGEMTGEETSQNDTEPSGDRPAASGEEGSHETDPSMPPDPWSNYIREQMWQLETRGKGAYDSNGKGHYWSNRRESSGLIRPMVVGIVAGCQMES